MATVALSLGVLGALVTQASLSTGCSRSEPPAPSAVPEPRAAVPPPAPSAAPDSTDSLDVGGEMFSTTKSAPVFRPKARSSATPAGESGILQNAPAPTNAAPSKAHAPQ